MAPYEADAQMAYLARRGDVHAVITEDSDLLTYGCPRVLFKMDKAGGGEEICVSDLERCRELPMAGFTHDMFMEVSATRCCAGSDGALWLVGMAACTPGCCQWRAGGVHGAFIPAHYRSLHVAFLTGFYGPCCDAA